MIDALSLSPAKTLQTFLDDPNLLFVGPIPPATKIIDGQNLNGGNDCSA
jgi:hypothetical protein